MVGGEASPRRQGRQSGDAGAWRDVAGRGHMGSPSTDGRCTHRPDVSGKHSPPKEHIGPRVRAQFPSAPASPHPSLFIPSGAMSAADEKASIAEARAAADAAAAPAAVPNMAPAPVPVPAHPPVAKQGFFARRKAKKEAPKDNADDDEEKKVVDVDKPKVEEITPVSFLSLFR